VQVAGAGERFVLGQMEASLVRRGCCTLLLHYQLGSPDRGATAFQVVYSSRRGRGILSISGGRMTTLSWSC
jgi:hypothetical protein